MSTSQKIVYLGSGSFGLPTLEKLKKSPHKISLIITGADKPAGRDLKLRPTPVKEWALKEGVSFKEHTSANSAELLEQILHLKPDFLVVIAFGVILKKPWLASAGKMCLNLHPSLLPLYRGAAPIHWPLLDGQSKTGVSIIRMNEKLDAGDIVLQKEEPIRAEDDFLSLEKRLEELGADLMLSAIDSVSDSKAHLTTQDETHATYARKLTKEDGRIRWDLSRREVLLRFQALKRWPGSFFFYQGKRILVEEMKPFDQKSTRPGEILELKPDQGLLVSTKDFALELVTLKPEGKKSMSAAEFLRGASLRAGELLE